MNALAGLMNPAAIGQQVTNAFEQGQQKRRETDSRNALAAYATNPNEETLNANAQYNPQMVIQERERMAQREAQQQQAKREQMGTMRKLLGHAKQNPMQALQAAQNMGLDTSGIPQPNDPGFQPWVDEQLFIMDALEKPEGEKVLSTGGKIAADAGLQPGTPEFTAFVKDYAIAQLSKPYTGGQGETRLYTPTLGGGGQVQGGPQPGAVEDGYRFKGGDPADPASWEQMGGQTAQPSATFSGSFRGLSGEQVTSTYRDPAKNRAVGGVANSFHTRKDAQGRPLARDSVPPAGMGMADYAAQLRRMNPDMDVINEGDHVHMEPRG